MFPFTAPSMRNMPAMTILPSMETPRSIKPAHSDEPLDFPPSHFEATGRLLKKSAYPALSRNDQLIETVKIVVVVELDNDLTGAALATGMDADARPQDALQFIDG